MIRAEDTALVLLAAGRSQRFGPADKLAEPFLDKPLAFHVVTALEAVPFRCRIAVVSHTRLDFADRGYGVIENPDPAAGMAGSLKLGVVRARDDGAAAVLVALADMPRVTATHIYRLLDYGEGPNTILASSDGVQPRPPALFGRDRFDQLLALEGDAGARPMIAEAHHVIASADELTDIDTAEELAQLRERFGRTRD